MKDTRERLRLKLERKFVDYIMLDELEAIRPEQVPYILEAAGLEIVEDNDPPTIGDQAIAKM